MKKIFILLLLLFTSGCYNYKELNDYSIVTGIAIDKQNDKYEVSALISNSTKSSQNQDTPSQIVVYSGKGDNIYQAIKNIGLSSPKELYLGHLSVVVISDELAKNGVNNVIDFFLREATVKKNFFLTISKDCKAKDTLSIITHLTNFPSQNISDNLKSTTQLQGIISTTTFNDFLYKVVNKGISPAINSITIVGNNKDGKSSKNTETSTPLAYTKLGTLGIFKNDKLIKWTTHDESLGINLINNNKNEIYLKIKINNGYIVLNINNIQSKTKIKFIDKQANININVKGDAKIVEMNSDIDLSNNNNIKDIIKKANKLLNKYMNKAIKLSIKENTDLFGWGFKIDKLNKKYFNTANWENYLKVIKYTTKSNINLDNKGSSKNSLEVIYE